MKVALVHDYLVDAGGAERVLEAFHELYPEAPVYTSIYNLETTFACFKDMDVRTSFLQYLTTSERHYKWLLPLYPFAFEKFDAEVFKRKIKNFLEEKLKEHRQKRGLKLEVISKR